MKACLIIEGAYPYVSGGVSSCVQQHIMSMPDVEFVILAICATRGEKKEFKYKIPDNVSRIEEIYLLDDAYTGGGAKRKLRLPKKVYEAIKGLLVGVRVDWKTIIEYFSKNNISINSLLAGEDFLCIAQEYYLEHFPRINFTDFLWTMRSMYIPIFNVLISKSMKADIYHSFSAGYAALWGCMQKELYNKPLLLSEHGIYTREREEEIIKAGWVPGIYKDLWIDQFRKIGLCGYAYSDRVTALFKDAKDFQVELGCEEDKIRIIPNGVDIEFFRDCAPKEPGDKFVNVGAVLRVTPIKDVKTLINAFSLAKEQNPMLKLWIMGSLDEDEEYANDCIKFVDELGIKDVEFTGNIQVKEYIGKMDMLMLSSISEGQPLAVLEAFAAKKPVIATNVGNCRGIIEGEFDRYGDAGYVVPVMGVTHMANAILRLAADESLRKRMGEVGYRRTREFYVKQDIYNQYVELYKEILSEYPSSLGVRRKSRR